jgi:adenylosuccinate lyase
VCGLARVVRGYAATALENMALWHERDISHSSAERVVFPDACCLVDFMALELDKVLAGLEVHPERMARNLDAGGGLVYSHRVLLALVESGMAREDAYLVVQSAALRALQGDGGFRANLEADPAVTAGIGDRLDAIFDPEDYLRHIEVAFERLGLGEEVKV